MCAGRRDLRGAFPRTPGRFDAILMDVQMPNLNGLDATRRIRALEIPEAKYIPIIALTTDTRMEDVQNCMSAGMDLHLSKPVNMSKLLRALAALCGKKP